MKWENSERAALWKVEMKKELAKRKAVIDELFAAARTEDIVKLCVKVTEQSKKIAAIERCMEEDKERDVFF